MFEILESQQGGAVVVADVHVVRPFAHHLRIGPREGSDQVGEIVRAVVVVVVHLRDVASGGGVDAQIHQRPETQRRVGLDHREVGEGEAVLQFSQQFCVRREAVGHEHQLGVRMLLALHEGPDVGELVGTHGGHDGGDRNLDRW